MYVVGSEEMRAIEKDAIENKLIPAEILMENAAIGAIEEILKAISDTASKKVLIIAGAGNNGGDGFAAARLLFCKGIDVSIAFMGNINKLKPESLMNYHTVKRLHIPFISIEDDKSLSELKSLISSSLVVDALFGTGLSSPVRDPFYSIISLINENAPYVISLDLPSGIHADTGKAMGIAVKANETVTFGYGKKGLYAGEGKLYSGKIHIKEISLPPGNTFETFILNDKEAAKMLPERHARSNKGSHGKAFLFAGSKYMAGANILSSNALYKAGAGLILNCCPAAIAPIISNNCHEAVIHFLPDNEGCLSFQSFLAVKESIKEADIIVIGPGLSVNENTETFTENILKSSACPVIIDADGLNIISRRKELLKYIKDRGIITPHPGEMSRLSGLPINEILDDTINAAKSFAMEHEITVLLKDAATIVASPGGKTYINTSGNQSMAKAGSGDVLTGIIGGLLAQGSGLFESASLGAYIHGKSGEYASTFLSIYGVTANDLIDAIPYAINKIARTL
ncbi:NAD(P)H-hydrate dehydratase [Anaeropeptidivorans aminofermentans]|uniref:NAD(P)H-hydrate dehydratase n=1 Tax=Anaeropeptidivorans aminofermentans TaxID=2934315 RepID=UPI002023F2F0|nr:NAD(P)H-hydrate dehydratase [Anaeropeptidivorans aminofermentans]